MISQLTVFLTNEQGRLAALCRTMADADINMHSLFIADTTDFGVVRICCDTPNAALAALKAAGYRASVTDVLAVEVPNEKGGLAKLLEFLDAEDVNVSYGYCFLADSQRAIDVLKIDGPSVEERLEQAGFRCVEPQEIYQPD